jgi:hypothetical protein
MPEEATPDQEEILTNVSSNTLFHFTNEFVKLEGILSNDFCANYCPEYSILDDFSEEGDELPHSAWPMVSFCDLPIFQIKNHLRDYGYYGVGLTKSWGRAHGISPVLYMARDSQSRKSLKTYLGTHHYRNSDDVGEVVKSVDSKLLFQAYIKLYEGPAWRKGNRIANVKFYDEREWRYVPAKEQLSGASPLLMAQNYQNEVWLADQTEKLHRIKLTFKPWDIQFLFVKEDNEILTLVDRIKDKMPKYKPNDVTMLTTKIISWERIKEDF